ncbi:peptidylprolyl isomerase [Microbispora sp. NPDC088329]|uniref:peptidylprolyl isomerase n=1 Tax=Microbispora sp. NPDC088329 TaxID=3154869 RepID=UPI003446281B
MSGPYDPRTGAPAGSGAAPAGIPSCGARGADAVFTGVPGGVSVPGAVSPPEGALAGGEMIAAVVGEQVITAAEVDRRLRLMRGGPLAARLPHPGTAEGRNLRRWLVQVMVAETLAEQEAARLGLASEQVAPPEPLPAPGPCRRSGRPALPDAANDSAGASGGTAVGPGAVFTLAGALRTGGVVAAVLAASPAARAVCQVLAAGREPSEDEVRDYYRRNLDRFTTPETRWVRPFGRVRRGQLTGPIEDAVFAAREGETTGPVEGPGGPWTLVVERIEAARREPYAAVRERIGAELAKESAERAFARWLDARQADSVVLTPGHEHPADPAQPDAGHRH